MATENLNFGTGAGQTPTPGSVGLNSQLPGSATTVSGVASATGGVGPGNLIEADIDEMLFSFQSEDTALMSLMAKSKKVKVASPEVEHFMIDEQRSELVIEDRVKESTSDSFILPLRAKDRNIPREYQTLLVRNMDGWAADGETTTPGKWLMLFVTGRDTVSGNPIVRAVNGPKDNPSNTFCSCPAIDEGTHITILGNALYETQKEVDPDLIIPQPTIVYLQKRGMNQVVSDYFEAQKKHIPFSQAVIAQQAILNFKRAGNRTLWAGHKGKFPVTVPKLGEQMVYFTEGIRWQFKREFQHAGAWTVEKLIALAKAFYTGEDVPKSAMLLAGKNLLEQLQLIDFSKHPEVQVIQTSHPTLGWSVTRFHTVFGDIDIKREPTLDTLGWSNSGALIGEDRLVHYTYSSQHEFNDRVEGEEATRKGIVVWDGLALKGACHIWIDGESIVPNDKTIRLWDSEKAPQANAPGVYNYLLVADCPEISKNAKAGQMWRATIAMTGIGENMTLSTIWERINSTVKI